MKLGLRMRFGRVLTGIMGVIGLLVAGLVAPARADGTVVTMRHSERPRLPTPFKTGFGPEDLGVIVNDADPDSVRIGNYYKAKRRIPDRNVIHVSFRPGGTVMSPDEFARIKADVDARTPAQVQAYALTWTTPYRVDCMSITTAFAAGFDKRFCAEGCAPTRISPYFDSGSRRPYRDFGWRPTMSLAGSNVEEVMALIDRGVASDRTFPGGTGYLVDTGDKWRNVRAPGFEPITGRMQGVVDLAHVRADYIEGREDVLFYFTGMERVAHLETNRFVPGAIADHLTSMGGQLTGTRQMSSLRWLEAGATGSYGAVVEPCNYTAKFPDPAIVIERYTKGETLIEAYWKSVAMPGQGIYIGEPLAKPYGGGLRTIR